MPPVLRAVDAEVDELDFRMQNANVPLAELDPIVAPPHMLHVDASEKRCRHERAVQVDRRGSLGPEQRDGVIAVRRMAARARLVGRRIPVALAVQRLARRRE